MSPEVTDLAERSTEPVARARAARIRQGIHNYLETLAEIALAYERRDWAVLGYADWQAYVDGEFGAERLRLPAEHRQKAVAELRLAGMSQRAIGTALGVDAATVNRDLRGVAAATPAEITGADGKTYAATRPTPPTPPTEPAGPPAPARGPAPGEQVWIATARKGIAAHAIKSSMLTRCSRATRTGLTLTAQQALDRWQASWCQVCWPEVETTRFAAGDTAHAGPSVETRDPRASQREAGAEIRGSAPAGTTPETAAGVPISPADGVDTAVLDAGDAAPAPAPPSATSPAAGGAGVTPDSDEPRLTVDQIARLRQVFGWARANQARHPNSGGRPHRGEPRVIGREYTDAERSRQSAPARGPLGGVVYAGQRAAHVEVCWEYDELEITYRSERHVISEQQIAVPGVDEALDVLCALGILPAWLSRQYAAGVQAGMRAGDAIDGEWTEGPQR